MLRRRQNRTDTTNDRAWSTSARPTAERVSTELVASSALPAETGPTWAPDRMAIWPVEGGRFGVDAEYHGASGKQRATVQARRLRSAGLRASARQREDGGTALRLGPLTHAAAWLAVEAFIGRPVPNDDV